MLVGIQPDFFDQRLFPTYAILALGDVRQRVLSGYGPRLRAFFEGGTRIV